MKLKYVVFITSFTLLSLVLSLLILWLTEYIGFLIPQLIPGINISTYGTFILLAYIIIFIFQQKLQIKLNAKTSISQLVIASTIIAFITQFVYLIIRDFIIFKERFNDKMSSILIITLISTIIFSIIATSIAVEIKKIKGIWRYIPVLVFIILFFLSKDYIKNIHS